jgi:hypothetical protein
MSQTDTNRAFQMLEALRDCAQLIEDALYNEQHAENDAERQDVADELSEALDSAHTMLDGIRTAATA